MSDTTGQVSDETLAELRRLAAEATPRTCPQRASHEEVIIVSVSPDGEEARKVISRHFTMRVHREGWRVMGGLCLHRWVTVRHSGGITTAVAHDRCEKCGKERHVGVWSS